MNLERYTVETTPDFMEYVFISDGPKGPIKKVVRFTKVKTPLFTFYNLAFGDWNDDKNRLDDLVITNNGDTEKILATVATTIVNFTNHYSDAIVYVEGSTRSRTRRYQMAVNKYLNEISLFFDVYGLIEGQEFKPFKSGEN